MADDVDAMRFAAAIAAIGVLFGLVILGVGAFTGASEGPVAAAPAPAVPAGWREYVLEGTGFAIAIPPGWMRLTNRDIRVGVVRARGGRSGPVRSRFMALDESAMGRRVARREGFVTNAGVMRAPVVVPRDRLEAQAVRELRIEMRPRGRVKSEFVEMPAGQALRLELKATSPNKRRPLLALTQYRFFAGGVQYAVTFATTASAARVYRPTFDRIARTFRVLERAEGSVSMTEPADANAVRILTKRDAVAAAKGMLLTRHDLPPGWSRKPPEKDGDGPCDKLLDIERHFPTFAYQESGTLTPGGVPLVVSDAAIFPNPRVARRAFDFMGRVLTGHAFRRCMETEFVAEKGGPRFGKPRIQSMPVPRLQAKSAGWRLTLPVTNNGVPSTIFFDLISMQRGQSVASFLAMSLGSPYDEPERDRLLGLLDQRMPKHP